MPNSRRIRNYLFSPEMIGEFCRTGTHHFKVQGVPVDADFKAAHWDFQRRCFAVPFSHPSFDEITDLGQRLPEAEVTVTKTPCQQWRIGRKYTEIEKLRYPDGRYLEELDAVFTGSLFVAIPTLWVEEDVFQLEWLDTSGSVVFKVEVVPPVAEDNHED